MPPVLFPSSTAPGKDAIESAGRLINCYSEKLQAGGPAQSIIRRTPGLTEFCTTSETGFRGMWFDGESKLYAAWSDELFWINSEGTETSIGELVSSSLTFLSSASDDTNATTYTYPAVALGAAHFNRRIVVAVLFDVTGDAPLASLTIGGVSATLVASQSSRVALYIALVPTGTTGNIVVTYANPADRSAIGVWRVDGLDSNAALGTAGDTDAAGELFAVVSVPRAGVVIAAAVKTDNTDEFTWTALPNGLTEDFDIIVEATRRFSGASAEGASASEEGASPWTRVANVTTTSSVCSVAMASWSGSGSSADGVTFAKNNKLPVPDQVLTTTTTGAFTFTTSSVTSLDVNSELPNSVCFGEGYFFFTCPTGRCYASGINDTTVNSLDSIRAEQRPEALIRGVWYNGELYAFGVSHTEVWASRGNPNPSGFPLNYVTTIWRGIVGTLAVTGFEEGFEGGMFWVADDNSVRMLNGYQPQTISTPALERAIEACTGKANIRAFCYDVDGHAAVVIDLNGEGTWVYDITEGGLWHERDTADSGAWRATGNSVRAFEKWLVGDHLTGNIYQVDETALDDGGSDMPFIIESIAMEAFPARLKVSRAEFNFISGVGNAAVPTPEVEISWSDTGGHRWTDPMIRRLGEDGRYYEQIRVNGLGMTGVKGRRFRLRVDDEVEVGLLAGSMNVATL